MVDIEKQVQFWRAGAEEDWQVAGELLANQRIRHGLFFAHLALEKTLKALVCKRTQDLAPRLHNLVRLAELAELELSQDQVDVLAEMNAFNIEGRYPELLLPEPDLVEAQEMIIRSEEVMRWLKRQLSVS